MCPRGVWWSSFVFILCNRKKQPNLRKSSTCSSSALSTKMRVDRANTHPPQLISIYNIKSSEFYFIHKYFSPSGDRHHTINNTVNIKPFSLLFLPSAVRLTWKVNVKFLLHQSDSIVNKKSTKMFKIAKKNTLSCQRKVQSQRPPRRDPIAQTSNLDVETFQHLKCPVHFIHVNALVCVFFCVRQTSDVTSVNNFPVCGLFTLLLDVSTEAIVCGFGVEAQDLPLLVDPEREGWHRRPDEDSAITILIRNDNVSRHPINCLPNQSYVTPVKQDWQVLLRTGFGGQRQMLIYCRLRIPIKTIQKYKLKAAMTQIHWGQYFAATCQILLLHSGQPWSSGVASHSELSKKRERESEKKRIQPKQFYCANLEGASVVHHCLGSQSCMF